MSFNKHQDYKRRGCASHGRETHTRSPFTIRRKTIKEEDALAMGARHTLAALLLFAAHTLVNAQTCTNIVQNMTMCPMLNGLSTNATAAEVAYFDEQMTTLIPYIYTSIAMQTEITNTSLCTASVHAYACSQIASTSDMLNPCFPPEHPLKPCYDDCKRVEACLPTNTVSICVDDGKRASNRECIGTGEPYAPAPATTPTALITPATTPTALITPATTPTALLTSDAQIRELSARLPVIILVLIASYIF